MGKTLARWSVEMIFIVVHVKGMHLDSPIRTMLGLVAMGLMEKSPLLLRTTVVISSRFLNPKLAVVCPDLTQSQIATAQLLGILNYSTSINREGSHLNSRNQYAIIFTWRIILMYYCGFSLWACLQLYKPCTIIRD
ncbi:unnamed protein product [Penicillium nalgiovense]|uniref:Uncharacterized protein n=1 Tax=Penicillium nalgiovense TaxID=60175 RepID=A0A9W4N295_PENNA|nr:unnamed protein product [Penicillium nalgiovense]CAG8195765.1 unnamed protein product [Penicillium nalgiovense]CAG8196032.1 unnamed protein product [Penicillium nalgiovense]CAG8196742.1 unnamed protein product [Penicillium nalgiovense]CAG8198889.1 unnamed protein product [Penicillium nalgiovense]